MESSKVITDPIHGTIVLDDYLIKIVNHRYFQRLRHIKQLQGVEHVYPGGVHSRFSHSLGVCFLAIRVLDTLKKYGAKIDDLDEKCVAIAALCHDIGHGPFSHLYEIVANEVDDIRWKHEVKSMELTEKILEDLKLFDDLEIESATKKIKTMIEGKKVEDMTEEEKEKAYLFQIVSNANSGVDVDKWDYFIRDTHACGFPSNFHKDRAIYTVRVRKLTLEDSTTANVLSFPIKDEINMYNMFGLRYTLHSRVLQHKVVCCVHEMIADVLKCVDNTRLLKFNGTLISTKECRQKNATEKYCMMDDRLIYLIYYAHVEDENIQKARYIIDRIRDRDFYQCIEEKLLTKTNRKQESMNEEEERKADECEKAEMKKIEDKLMIELEKYLKVVVTKVYGEKKDQLEPNLFRSVLDYIVKTEKYRTEKNAKNDRQPNMKMIDRQQKIINEERERIADELEKAEMKKIEDKLVIELEKYIDRQQKIINEERERIADECEKAEMKKIKDKLMIELQKYSEREKDNMNLKRELVDKKEKEDPVFRIKMKVINYGNKDKNPIRNVYFHGKKGKDVIEYIESDSPMVPKCFEEKTVQIICTLSKKCFRKINWDEIKKKADVDGIIKRIPGKIDKAVASVKTE